MNFRYRFFESRNRSLIAFTGISIDETVRDPALPEKCFDRRLRFAARRKHDDAPALGLLGLQLVNQPAESLQFRGDPDSPDDLFDALRKPVGNCPAPGHLF